MSGYIYEIAGLNTSTGKGGLFKRVHNNLESAIDDIRDIASWLDDYYLLQVTHRGEVCAQIMGTWGDTVE